MFFVSGREGELSTIARQLKDQAVPVWLKLVVLPMANKSKVSLLALVVRITSRACKALFSL